MASMNVPSFVPYKYSAGWLVPSVNRKGSQHITEWVGPVDQACELQEKAWLSIRSVVSVGPASGRANVKGKCNCQTST